VHPEQQQNLEKALNRIMARYNLLKSYLEREKSGLAIFTPNDLLIYIAYLMNRSTEKAMHQN